MYLDITLNVPVVDAPQKSLGVNIMMHRVVIHLPEDVHHKIHLEATRRAIGVSTLIRQIIIDHAPQNSPPVHVDNNRQPPKINHQPKLPELTEDEFNRELFKMYQRDGGQINNFAAWVEAGKPAPENRP